MIRCAPLLAALTFAAWPLQTLAWGSAQASVSAVTSNTVGVGTASNTGMDPANDNGRAFERPLTALRGADLERFAHGRTLLQREWPIEASDPQGGGLGPLFNQRSCIACHPGNGRGHPPETSDEPLTSALVRLSIRSGVTVSPHPSYGWQLNPLGIAGVPGEGRAVVRYTTGKVQLGLQEIVELRKPQLSFRDLHYGPMGPGVMTSLRVAPPIFGLGLIELVDDSTLLAFADPEHANGGIRGHPNMLWNAHQGRQVVGRFGLKANMPDLHTQIASAFSEDLGITTPRFPETNCTPAEAACRKAAAKSGSAPEGTPATHHDIPFYLMQLLPPPRRLTQDAGVLAGEATFREIGCASCHRETMVTGDSEDYPSLAHTEFHPYSDLLLHDMGPGLADGRPDQQAGASDWRTTPLWGLGLAQAIDARARFLHDGRARTVTEAILWHDGEARGARERFAKLTDNERSELLRFLQSL